MTQKKGDKGNLPTSLQNDPQHELSRFKHKLNHTAHQNRFLQAYEDKINIQRSV